MKEKESSLIKADGTTELVNPENDGFFGLTELQKFVGGYIEIVPLTKQDILVVNEEGKIRQLPINLNATKILQSYYKTNDYVVGDVLLTSRKFIR